MNRIQELYAVGQSIWFDFIERNMVQQGDLQALVAEGVAGVTSNPTIFQGAIAKSPAYADDLRRLVEEGKTSDPKRVFEALAIADIQAAADVLRPVYERQGGHDGFVSLEVAPDLAYDTEATVEEARRLHAAVQRPNLMVKVPATEAGIDAIRRLIADGININVTLIFGLDRYAAVREAYLRGLEERLAANQPIDRVASVASFFVSRVDTNVDARLERIAEQQPERAEEARALLGKAAIANAKLAYRDFRQTFSGPRWETLAAAGARVQRPLWASTGTKNPDYSDLLYVETLMGPDTVNTMPPQTLDAFRDHGSVALTVDKNVELEAERLAALADLGISIDEVTEELEREGVQKFADSFTALLETIEQRRAELAAA